MPATTYTTPKTIAPSDPRPLKTAIHATNSRTASPYHHTPPSMRERDNTRARINNGPRQPLLNGGINFDAVPLKRKGVELSSEHGTHADSQNTHYRRTSSQATLKNVQSSSSPDVAGLPGSGPATKKPRVCKQGKDVQVVYLSSRASTQSSLVNLPSECCDKAQIQVIRFKDTGDECLALLRGISNGILKPILKEPPNNGNVAILPVGGPDTTFVSPYTYALDKPLGITVSSGSVSGLGMFAKRRIRQGAEILSERPVMILSDPEDAEDVLARMNRDFKGAVESLYDCTAVVGRDGKGGNVLKMKSPTGIVRSNAFEVELDLGRSHESQSCSAVFLQAARCNHSCGPSAIPTFNAASLTLTLYATRDLEPGEEITIPYLPVTSSDASITSPPSSPPTSLGQFRPASPSGMSSVSESTTASSASVSSMLSSSSSYTNLNVPPIYLPRHERRRLLQSSHGFECHCAWCDLPWSEVDGVHKSDRARKEIGLYNTLFSDTSNVKLRKKLGVPTFEEWCANPSLPWDSLISKHSRLLALREQEGLQLTPLALPRLSDDESKENNRLTEEGWLKHADVLGMCFGALGDKKAFRGWIRAARDVRWALCGNAGDQEEIEHIKVLDTWLENPNIFPLWGWRDAHGKRC